MKDVFLVRIFGTLGVLLGKVSVEDAELKKVFGRVWDEWSQRAPYALVPGVY